MSKPFLHRHRRVKNGEEHWYWGIAEKLHTTRGVWVQRSIVYLGEINDIQRAPWTKVIEVFDTRREQTAELALYPREREFPARTLDHGVEVCLSGFVLRGVIGRNPSGSSGRESTTPREGERLLVWRESDVSRVLRRRDGRTMLRTWAQAPDS